MNSIRTNLNLTLKNAVDELRCVRNEIANDQNNGTLSDVKFEKFDKFKKVKTSFNILRFPLREIDYIRIRRNSFNSFKKLPCKPNHYVVKRDKF